MESEGTTHRLFIMKIFEREVKEMADAVITKKGREKLCRAHAGDLNLPRLKYIAYGDGGADENQIALPTTGEEVSLRNERFRIELDSHNYPIPTTCQYESELDKSDLANVFLSEMGIFDEEEDLIIYKTFLPKGKDDDMLFNFSIKEIF